MTLVKWTPTRSLITDFDRMMDNIFNDGWNVMPNYRSHSPAVDIVCLLYTSPSPRDRG